MWVLELGWRLYEVREHGRLCVVRGSWQGVGGELNELAWVTLRAVADTFRGQVEAGDMRLVSSLALHSSSRLV